MNLVSLQQLIDKFPELFERQKFIFTTDHLYCVTFEQLQKEINNILTVKGRASIIELADFLNVDITYINKVVDVNLSSVSSKFCKIHGELYSRELLKKYTSSITKLLGEMGEVDLTFISNHFKLPKETLLKIIEDAGIPILRGRASNSHLIAPTSFKSVRCHKVLGVFRALTKPLLLSVIKDKYHFQDDLYDVVRGLIQEKLLLGTIDNAQKEMIYTPAIYNSLREQWLRETLCHNGYLESSRALAMGIPNTSIKRYCNQFLDGVLLSTLFIGKELLRQLYDTFRELLFWKGFISLNELKDFTSCLTMKDWEILLSFLNSASGNFDKAFETLQSIQLEGGCGSLAQTNFDIIFINKKMLCTRQFIDQLSDLLKSTVQNLTFKYAQDHFHNKRMLKNNSLKEKTCFFKENSERLIQLVVGDIVEKETTLLIHYGMSKPFLTSLLNYLVPKLFQETAKEFSSSTLEIEELKKVQRKNDLEQKFSQLLDSAFLFTESFKILPKPRKLEKYFMATLTGQLTLLLKGYSLMNFDWCPSESEEKNKSSEDLETVLSKFPDHEGLLALNELENSTKNNKKDCRPHTFLSKLITTAKLNGLFYRKRDKRKEKQLKIALASSLRFQLHRTEDYASAFHIIVLLLFYEKTGCLLHSDGKCVPSIIENIHELSILAEETVADLQSLQDSIVKMTAFDAEEPKKEVLCSFVQNRLEDLKKELRIHTEWCDKNNGRE